MGFFRRPLWLYPLFQIPLMFLGTCLFLAALFAIFGLGKPKVSVAIALDLSSSTYDNVSSNFNAPGTVMSQEVAAVNSYLGANDQLLKEPNAIQVFGFGENIKPLTTGFKTNSKDVETELKQSLENPSLPFEIGPDKTEIDLAIQQTTAALSNVKNSCRELLLVTDGGGNVSNNVIAKARNNRVKINAVVLGEKAEAIEKAAINTGGIPFYGQASNLIKLFTQKFFIRFNSNWKWIIFWLGAAWISLMWVLVLPLDRWIFQGYLKLNMTLAGQLAIANALFWTVTTLSLIWRISGLPLFSYC